jgi:hypothetical protein
MALAMLRLETAGYPIILTVHDEIICEVPEGFGNVEEFHRLLTVVPDWAEGLPIAAKVWTRQRYAKSKTAPSTCIETGPRVASARELPDDRERTQREGPKFFNDPDEEPNSVHVEEVVAGADHDDDDDDDDGPSWINVPLADLIAEPLDNGKMLCPFHEDHHPSLHVYPDHYRCYTCGAHGNQLDWLMLVDGMDREEALILLNGWDGPRYTPARDDGAAKLAFALQLWEDARPIAGTLAERYLVETRGLGAAGLAALPAGINDVRRFHPRCPFGPGNRGPCLIALMRDARTDAPTGIQRTGLTADAKKIDRRMLGRIGTVKLWPAGAELIIGEGLETVLAAATRIAYRDAPLQPAWATLSADALGQFPLLRNVERLIILVDHDPPGKTAASFCAGRYERAGRSAVQLTPDEPGFDFNDLLMVED